ncbi:MAG TPA: beta-ketoacyl-ACP synthase II [Magnetospirillaceae bacterium]|nr:beta-ketoacyl-ACP synthase II [Magnetospirillaceae bacterium]
MDTMRRVVVTGMGVVSPVGNDIPTFWDAVRNGRSGIGPVTRFDASRLEARIAGEVKDLDVSLWMDRKDARKMALFSQYAVAAAAQAWNQAGLDAASTPRERIAIVIGNGIGGEEVHCESYAKMLESGPGRIPPMTIPLMIMNEAAGNIALRFQIKGPAYTMATACASGTDALGQALDMIRAGRCDVAVAGGTEAALTEFSIGGFCRIQALSTKRNDDPTRASRPFDKDRDGFVIAEGAGMMILESMEHALARGAPIIAELAGYGATCDSYHLTAPDPEGRGGALAITRAVEDAGLAPSDIQYYNAHGTSTPINDPTETLMVKNAFGDHASRLKISSTKSVMGHLVAAAGAVEAIVCVMAIRDGFCPPTINLDEPDPGCDLDYVPNRGIAMPVLAAASVSLGFGGHNGCVVFRRA